MKLILNMLFNFGTVEQWFEKWGLCRAHYLPLVVLRLVQLVITICINTSSGNIHIQVKQSLSILFGGQCPVLAELPQQFREQLQYPFACSTAKGPQLWQLVSAFSGAMNSIGDPLILLKSTGSRHNNMSWHGTASQSLRVVTVELQNQPSVSVLLMWNKRHLMLPVRL